MNITVIIVVILAAFFAFLQAGKAIAADDTDFVPMKKQSQIAYLIAGIIVPIAVYSLSSLIRVFSIVGIVVCSLVSLIILALQALNQQGKHRAASWDFLALAYAGPWWISIAKLMDWLGQVKSPKPLIIPALSLIATILVGLIRTKAYDSGKDWTTSTAGLTVAITAAVIAAVVLF